MSADPTKVPGFPKVPASANPELRQYLEKVSEAVEIRLGRRGDPIDRAVTLRELIDSGMAKRLLARPFDPNRGGPNTIDFTDPDSLIDTDIPLRPTGFSVNGAYSQINMSWDFPNYKGHNQTEIWGHATNVIGSATLVGVSTGMVYVDPVGSGVSKYYWIRHVNTKGVHGPWNSTTGTLGQTATDVAHMLNVLTGAITSGQLATALATPINNLPNNTTSELATINAAIDAINNIPNWATGTAYTAKDLVVHSSKLYEAIQTHTSGSSNQPTGAATDNAFWKFIGTATTLASVVGGNTSGITEINTLTSSSNSAAARKITALDSEVFDSSGNGILASASAVSALETEVYGSGGASASRIDAVTARIDDVNGILAWASGTSYSVDDLVVFSNKRYQALQAHTSSSSNQPSGTTADNTNWKFLASDAAVTVEQLFSASAKMEGDVAHLEGQYTVKIDNDGHVAGFGLSNLTNAEGGASSEFIIRADRFALVNATSEAAHTAWAAPDPVPSPPTYTWSKGAIVKHNGFLYVAKLDHSNTTAPSPVTGANAAYYWDCISTPFVVQTTTANVSDGAGGTTQILPGVYIRSANIHNASIESAQIKSVNATTITTGTLDVTNRITAGSINASKLKIDNSSITSQEINGVPTLIIGQAGITTAMIGNAQVNTLQVAGNAITASAFASKAFNTTNHLTLTMSDTPATNGVNQPYIFHIMAIVNDVSSNNAVLSPAGTYRLKITTYTNGANAQSNIYWLYAYGTDVISVRRLANANSGTVGVKAECFVDQACTTSVPSSMIQITGHTGKR